MKEAEHSRLVGGMFKKHENLQMKFALGRCNVSIFLHLSSRTLRIYSEALTGFSHTYYSLKDTSLFQGYTFGTAPSMGMVGRKSIPRMRSE